ncbi:MAG TPA: hypothetical protein VL854_05735 [Nitrososphaeraceae archaeon]|nr:hypothetical protein [Nitrososphaeraceae archaeon]
MTTQIQVLKQIIEKKFDKATAVSVANQEFEGLSSTRKETIIRSLYMNDLTIRRMWEENGLHYEVVASEHHRLLEYAHVDGEKPDMTGAKTYEVIVDRKLKWHCNCYWFGRCQNLDECTHIRQIKLTNILKEYLPYFIYAYRFLLPHHVYKKFFLEFVVHR